MSPPRAPRLSVLLLLALGAAVLVLLFLASPRAAATDGRPPPRQAWRWPVRGAVVHGFAYARPRAFAPGQRRGGDLAAAPGAPGPAACTRRGTFAGRVPAGGGGGTPRRRAPGAPHPRPGPGGRGAGGPG